MADPRSAAQVCESLRDARRETADEISVLAGQYRSAGEISDGDWDMFLSDLTMLTDKAFEHVARDA